MHGFSRNQLQRRFAGDTDTKLRNLDQPIRLLLTFPIQLQLSVRVGRESSLGEAEAEESEILIEVTGRSSEQARLQL